jgi:TusA-related sulfurtransferase
VQGNAFHQQETDPQTKQMMLDLTNTLKGLQNGMSLSITIDEKGLLKAIRTDAKNQKQDAIMNGVK